MLQKGALAFDEKLLDPMLFAYHIQPSLKFCKGRIMLISRNIKCEMREAEGRVNTKT